MVFGFKRIRLILLATFALAACQSSIVGNAALATAGFESAGAGNYFCPAAKCGADVHVVVVSVADPTVHLTARMTAEDIIRSGQFEGSDVELFIRQAFGGGQDQLDHNLHGAHVELTNMTADRKTATVDATGRAQYGMQTMTIHVVVRFQQNTAAAFLVASPSPEAAARFARTDLFR